MNGKWFPGGFRSIEPFHPQPSCSNTVQMRLDSKPLGLQARKSKPEWDKTLGIPDGTGTSLPEAVSVLAFWVSRRRKTR